jgi:hypothetical protein
VNGKLRLYKRYGYWNCNWNGIHGAGYTVDQAIESMLKTKRFWAQTLGMSDLT